VVDDDTVIDQRLAEAQAIDEPGFERGPATVGAIASSQRSRKPSSVSDLAARHGCGWSVRSRSSCSRTERWVSP
jgi:hypothetical protein